MADCLIQGRVGESVLKARRLRQLGIREYNPVCEDKGEYAGGTTKQDLGNPHGGI